MVRKDACIDEGKGMFCVALWEGTALSLQLGRFAKKKLELVGYASRHASQRLVPEEDILHPVHPGIAIQPLTVPIDPAAFLGLHRELGGPFCLPLCEGGVVIRGAPTGQGVNVVLELVVLQGGGRSGEDGAPKQKVGYERNVAPVGVAVPPAAKFPEPDELRDPIMMMNDVRPVAHGLVHVPEGQRAIGRGLRFVLFQREEAGLFDRCELRHGGLAVPEEGLVDAVMRCWNIVLFCSAQCPTGRYSAFRL
eukprot:219351_1